MRPLTDYQKKLRLAVILFYFEEMDIAATAQVLGIPEEP